MVTDPAGLAAGGDDELGATTLVERTWYSRPALIPPVPWIDGRAPQPPSTSTSTARGARRRSASAGDRSSTRYAIYRLPRTRDRIRTGDCRLADATYLPAVLPARGSRVQGWTDPAGGDGSWTYVVTALDRTWNESAPRQVSTR